jgi:hypothetical protein
MPDAQPLAGSLPFSVRTFLSRLHALEKRGRGSDRPTCSHARHEKYSKSVFNTYSTKKRALFNFSRCLVITEILKAHAQAIERARGKL